MSFYRGVKSDPPISTGGSIPERGNTVKTWKFRKRPQLEELAWCSFRDQYNIPDDKFPFYMPIRDNDGLVVDCYYIARYQDLAKTLLGWAVVAIAYKAMKEGTIETMMVEYRVQDKKRSPIRWWRAITNER